MRARKVIVRVARTATPSTHPVSAAIPLGMSMASTGAAPRLTRAIRSASAPSTSRARPMPRRPSTTRAGRRLSGHSRTDSPPAARKRSRAARASGACGGVPAKSRTVTRWNQSRRCAAATQASPPLLPGPASTRMGAPVSAAMARAASAVASPARCMSVGPARSCAARASSVRISAVVRRAVGFTAWWCADREPCPWLPAASAASRWKSAGRGSPGARAPSARSARR